MKTVKNSLLVLLTLITSVSYAQIEKYQKRYKIEKKSNYYIATKNNYSEVLILDIEGNEISKFDFKDKHFIDLTSTGKLLYGTKRIGFNDGGGFVETGLAGFTIEDLNTKEKETLNYDYFSTKVGQNLELYFVKLDDKIGVIDKDGKIVIDLKYKFINPFNENLESVAFTDNEYFIIDSTGKKKYDVTFKYSEKEISFPNYVNIDDKRLVGSYDGINKGWYDLSLKKELIPFKYTNISPNKDGKHFSLFKGNIAIFYNLETDQILLPESLNASAIGKYIINEGEYIIEAYKQNIVDGKSIMFIYRGDKDITNQISDITSIDLSYPLTTGRLVDNTKFVFDLRKNKLLMYGIPNIDYPRADVFENDDKYVIVTGEYNGSKNLPSNLKKISLLVDTDANILTPFLSHPTFKVFKFENDNTFVAANHRLEKGNVVSVYLKKKPIIQDVEQAKISNELNNDNQIEIKQNVTVEVPHPHPSVKRKELSPRVVRIFIDKDGKIIKTEPTYD